MPRDYGYVSVVPSAKDFGKKLKDETDGPSRSAGESAGDEFSGAFGGSLKKLAAVAAAAFAGMQIGQFLKDSIEAASDLSESMSKVGVVFGDSAVEVQDWAKTSAKAMGQSEQAALEAAGTLGNLFVALKLPQPEAAKMSKRMVELAGDLASFNNVSPEEALEALRAGLVGETEPLRRFGVNLNDATLKAKAFELGLSDGKTTLDANAKAQAAYALILEQTGTAQGDFARTSQGLANQQRIMSAQWQDLKASVGEAFLPAATAVARVISTSLLPALDRFVDDVGPKAADAVAGFVDSLGKVPDAVRSFAATLKTGLTENDVATPLEAVALKVRDLVDEFKKLSDWFSANKDILTVFAASAAAGAAGLLAYAGAAQGIGAALTAIKTAQAGLAGAGGLASLLGPLAQAAAAAGPFGLLAAAIVAVGVAAFVAYKKVEPFRDAVDTTARVVADAAVTAFNALRGAVETVSAAFTAAFTTVRDVVMAAAAAVIAALTPIVDWFATHLFPALAAVAVFFAETWRFAYERVAEAVGLIIQIVAPFVQNLVDIIQLGFTAIAGAVEQAMIQITTAIRVALDILKPIWSIGWNVMLTVVETAFNLIRNAIEVTLNTIRGIFSAFTAALRGDWSGFWSALVSIVSGIFGGAVAAVSAVLQGISGAVSSILGGIPGIINGVAAGVRSAVSGITSALSSAVGTIEGLARRIRDAISSIPGAGVVGSILGRIPGLAAGGLVTKPTLAVVGEAGPEAVIPLSMFNQGVQFGRYPNLAAAAIPSGTGTASMGSPTINIYAPLGVDRNEVIASVQQGLRQYESARSTTRGRW